MRSRYRMWLGADRQKGLTIAEALAASIAASILLIEEGRKLVFATLDRRRVLATPSP